MSSSGTNQLTQPTINGLSNLELTELTTDTLNADNIDGEFFSIQTIEANDVQVDNELELTNNGFITIGKNTGSEITITDTEVGYLDGVTSNIQTQINNSITDVTQIQADVTAVEQEVDVLNNKTIYQSSDTTQQKTIFSNKLILSSLANLDVGTSIQTNTTNIGILTSQQSTNTADIATNTSAISNLSTQQTTNTNNISNLSTQQTTNTFNITQQGLSIGSTSGGPTNSLFDRVQNITGSSTATYNYGTFRQLNSGNTNTTQVTMNEGTLFIEGDLPAIRMYRTDSTGSGESSYIAVGPNSQLQIQNYQQNQNILISTASGSSSAQIDINSNSVKVNNVDVNTKFNSIDSDILGNSNAISSNNVSIQNNLTKITTNTTSINDLQTSLSPTGSIMIYAGSTAPSGWLMCDGTLISKSTYIHLWSLLGDTYLPTGQSPQTLSFWLMDLRQLFVTGAGSNGAGYGIQASSKSLGSFSAQSILQHSHSYERPTNSTQKSGGLSSSGVWVSNTQSTNTSGVVLPGGSTIPNNSENRPYCMAMNYIIKT
jgi:microcystin-dependent protein